MNPTQALIVLLLTTTCGFSQQKPDKFDKSMDHVMAGIKELKHDQAILEAVANDSNVKHCNDKGWPDDYFCNIVARAAVQVIMKHYVITPLTGGTK